MEIQKQSITAQSAVETEYVAMSFAIRELILLTYLLKGTTSLSQKETTPTILYADNQGAIAIASNGVSHDRSEHIDFKFHFIREQIAHVNSKLSHVKTGNMLSNIITKPLEYQKHRRFTRNFDIGALKADEETECHKSKRIHYNSSSTRDGGTARSV